MSDADDPFRLVAIEIDETTIERGLPDQEHERQIAIYDLIDQNVFHPTGHDDGPFALKIGLAANRLVFDIRYADGRVLTMHGLSLTPFRKIIKDYFMICESYYEAIRSASPERIEAIDMGRRGVHDEGARLVVERLEGKVRIDFATARRLFTLIAALNWKGSDR